jgi:hypothetical protein
MSWERTHRREDTVSPPLCGGLYKPGAGRHPGDIFRESIRGQSPCQTALWKELRIFLNCALARPTDQTDHLVLCVTCFKLNKPSYILLNWSLSWAITLWRHPRSSWRSLRSATTNVHPQQRGGTHPLGPRYTTPSSDKTFTLTLCFLSYYSPTWPMFTVFRGTLLCVIRSSGSPSLWDRRSVNSFFL